MDREKIITAAELMDMQFLPRSTVVDGMLPAGCYILAGAPKVGKSFLMAQLCWCVATGTPFLGQPTHRSQVLYLSLEDTGERVQGRLIRMFGVEHPVGRLHLTLHDLHQIFPANLPDITFDTIPKIFFFYFSHTQYLYPLHIFSILIPILIRITHKGSAGIIRLRHFPHISCLIVSSPKQQHQTQKLQDRGSRCCHIGKRRRA